MIDDLIKELRSYPAHYVAAHRASDVLERIDFYNCRLEDDLVKLEAAAESLREHIAEQQLDIITLGQEVGRLRTLLEETLAVMPICPPEFEHIVGAKARYELAILKARAALGEEKKP
jgi:hypothetical protein